MIKLTPQEVFPVLRKHMLVDGYDDIVVDLQNSQGSYIHDSLNGRRFLDLFGFFATVPVGHNHPRTHDHEFKEKMLSVSLVKPSNSDFYTTEMAEFVKVFSDYAIPQSMPHLFLVSGGALAVENAIKAAFDWKVRKNFQRGCKEEKGLQVLHFREAFHGRSGYTLSLTNTEPAKIMHFPKFSWPRVANPKITFPLNDGNLEKVISLEKQSVAEIKQAIHDNPNDIAAMILEPIQGEGGDNHFRAEFFHELRALADENEIMLIFDEVQTGVGLTGKMWCYQHFGVEPDMISFGKKTQVCGFLCGKRIEEVDDHVFAQSSRINSTWGGNLVDMVRFRKFLEIIVTDNLIENAQEVGDYFAQQLHGLEDEFEHMSQVRGRGLMVAFDLPSTESRNSMLEALYDNNVIGLSSGKKAIRFRPSLTISRAEVDEAITALRKSLKSVFEEASNVVAA